MVRRVFYRGAEAGEYSKGVLQYSSEEYSSILLGILQYSQGILARFGQFRKIRGKDAGSYTEE